MPPKWKKPKPGYVKLNFDGSLKARKASIGGVFRDHDGAFLLGYSERIGKATSCVAELVAAKRGLELALKNGWLNIWIEGDAQFVIDLLVKTNRVQSEKKKTNRVKSKEHANEIRKLASLLNHFHASHISRNGNMVAGKLSKLGYGMNKIKIWRDVPPDEIYRFLYDDATGNKLCLPKKKKKNWQ